jgi:hypothetical protein
MKYKNKISICKNSLCQKEFNKKDVGRQLGKESSAYLSGYCSAFCYTKDIIEGNIVGLLKE